MQYRPPSETPTGNPATATTLMSLMALAGTVAASLLWFVPFLSANAPALPAGVALLLLIAVPSSIHFADCLATHYVHWLTANPKIDHRTMMLLRSQWRRRWSGFGDTATLANSRKDVDLSRLRQVMSPRNHYPARMVACAVIVPLAIAICLTVSPLDYSGPLVAGVIVVLFLWGAFATCLQAPKSLLVFGQALEHWFKYGHTQKRPPWVFQSPFGSSFQRQAKALVPVASWAASLTLLWYEAVPVVGITPISQWGALGFSGLALAAVKIILLASVVPGLLFCGLVFVVVGPALSAHDQACEARGGVLRRKKWTAFDGYTNRLQYSGDREERDSLWLGVHTALGYPILLAIKLLFEHMHILGATGTSKTALGIKPLIAQLIRRGDGPVIIIDCKGDNALFNTARLEARNAGTKFKWFTNKPNRSTYIFNPFLQSHITRLSMQEVVGLFMLSLNLHHGDDYGRAYFSIVARRLFIEALQEMQKRAGQGRPLSFTELEKVIFFLATDRDEFKAAQHLSFIIQSLSEFEQLNLSPLSGHHPALDHAIHMPEVIDEKQVIYYSLVAATDLSSVSEIARLAMYSALTAAMDYRNRTGRRPNVYLIIDEAQNVVAKNIENVLAQAREHGLACVLCHQTMSQLNPPGGVDLRELVLNCTCVKQIFTARDPATKQFVSDISGEVGYYTAVWTQYVRRLRQGNAGKHVAVHFGVDPALAQVSEVIGPRLTKEDINDINRDPNCSVIAIERNQGYSCFLEAFPVHIDWMISQAEYEKSNSGMPWPADSDETITVEPFWPDSSGETIVPTAHPLPVAENEGLTQHKLSELKRLLDGDGP